MEIERDIFVDAEFLAKRYKVKKQTILDWLDQGKICPAWRIGKRVTRWRVSDLETWEAEKLSEATAIAKRKREVKDAVGQGRLAAQLSNVSNADATKLKEEART